MRAASCLLRLLALFCLSAQLRAAEPSVPLISGIDSQPLTAQIKRVIQALEYLGSPLPPSDVQALEKLYLDTEPEAVEESQKILDRHCLVFVNINPEARVKVAQGAAPTRLHQNGWKHFLVKVQNEAGVTAELKVASPQAQTPYRGGWFSSDSDRALRNKPEGNNTGADRWMDLLSFTSQPMKKPLSGFPLEYRIIQVYSRDAGQREAKLMFDVGQGTQDLGFRSEVDILFNAEPANEVTLRVRDENGKPTTGMFLIRDSAGHVYPSQAKRLAPDFGFHPQVYRADGETVLLPEGKYRVEFARGPESQIETRDVTVSKGKSTWEFQVKRWIDPSQFGYWSGDHHIHAAGCAHYSSPTEGVHAPDMMRQCLGEDLKIGANLTWGPCFDYQKQFFTGQIDKVSEYPYLLRYDIEVSGFGSHESGHLCLLRLKDQIYPGGDSNKHWPTLGLNTLKWAKKQGAITGPAHSGNGLQMASTALPAYDIPPFDGIGANEFIVDVTHEVPGPDGKLVRAVDFISTVDTAYTSELNIWYHTLNSGFRTRISGETDFPCVYGERVGLGRSYVHLDGKLTYEDWCEGLKLGRNYVSDGKTHLIDFKVNDVKMGHGESELHLKAPGKVKATVKVAGLLPKKPEPEVKRRSPEQKPYWDIERARVGTSTKVPVELIVNGYPVAKKEIEADGALTDLEFEANIEQSSWVAIRILPSSHTNPIFVLVNDKPIRASRRSAEWCLKSVEQCWSQKERFYKGEEKAEAIAAYDHARQTYRKIIQESVKD